VHDVFVLFGGRCLDGKRCVRNAALDDTWLYDLTTNTWTLMSPAMSPPPRDQQMMFFDPLNEVVVLFGGRNGLLLYDDLWVYDVGLNSWIEIEALSDMWPSARRLGSMVYDETLDGAVLYGGNGPKGGLNQVWTLLLTEAESVAPLSLSSSPSLSQGATLSATVSEPPVLLLVVIALVIGLLAAQRRGAMSPSGQRSVRPDMHR
jgi:hypothetical protein